MGEPLARFWFFTSVGENDSDSRVTWTEKQSMLGNPLQDFGSLLRLVKMIDYKKRAQWGNPLYNNSWYLYLYFLRRPREEQLIYFGCE